jgi:hypothetical protein
LCPEGEPDIKVINHRINYLIISVISGAKEYKVEDPAWPGCSLRKHLI